MSSEIDDALTDFDAVASPALGIPWTHHTPGTRSGKHVLFGVMTHGNECGALPAATRLIRDLAAGEIGYSGPVSLFVGNPDAGRAGKRFLDFDLNRAWTFDPAHEGREIHRAHALRPLVDRADLFLDFHQTLLATDSAFWTFPWDPVFGQWARVLQAAPVGITRPPGQIFAHTSLKCIDEYVRDRGRPGFTLELGEKGFDPRQADLAYATMRTLLETVERIDTGRTTLDDAARTGSSVEWFQTVYKEDRGTPERHLRPGLVSWMPVTAGDDVSAPHSPPIQVPTDGVLLFPKYPDGIGPDPAHLFHVASRMEAHPDELFGA